MFTVMDGSWQPCLLISPTQCIVHIPMTSWQVVHEHCTLNITGEEIMNEIQLAKARVVVNKAIEQWEKQGNKLTDSSMFSYCKCYTGSRIKQKAA